jgi:hypothetical protein
MPSDLERLHHNFSTSKENFLEEKELLNYLVLAKKNDNNKNVKFKRQQTQGNNIK